MSKLMAALAVFLCAFLFPNANVRNGKVENPKTSLADQDMTAVALAIEDEIYDEGCQSYGADASAGVHNGTYELPLYIKPIWNEQDLGWAIYELLPVGEVLRMFSDEPNGTAIIYGHPEWNFPSTEPSYLTVYMNDGDLCESKREWVTTKLTLELEPSEFARHLRVSESGWVSDIARTSAIARLVGGRITA
jgi:hypothetical protein